MAEEKKKKTIEDVLKQYAETAEGAEHLKEVGVTVPGSEEQVLNDETSTETEAPAETISAQELFARKAKAAANRPTMAEAHEIRKNEIKQELRDQGLGFIEIKVEDLPTQGLFYPEGTKLYVRSATGAELRHWSMTNEQELAEIDDALNYIFQRCCKISFTDGRNATWEDVKEIDRLYIILGIRDLTWPNGENALKINVSEKEVIDVHKDAISFIDLGDKIMKYYNPDQRCFTFPTKNKNLNQLNFYMPSIGVTQWLKSYIKKKTQRNELFDKDFVTVAPLLIKDYRKLNDNSYRDLITQSMSFTTYDWSLISKVKSIIEKAVAPKLTYIDEGGMEQETPLNFQGGIKAIFNLNLDEEIDL